MHTEVCMYMCVCLNVSVCACINQEVCYDISYQIQMITNSWAHLFLAVYSGCRMGERAFSQIQKLSIQYCFIVKTLKLMQNVICRLLRFRGLPLFFSLQIHRYSAVSGRQGLHICSFLTLNYGCVLTFIALSYMPYSNYSVWERISINVINSWNINQHN